MDPDFVNKYNDLLNKIKQIENFDGSDAQQLPKFMTKVENIMPILNSFDPFYRTTLFEYIKNKCTDRARELVIIRSGGNKAETWLKLKELLLHNYAEKEASCTLVHKIRCLVLDTNIEQYYQKISKLKQRLLNRKMTHNDSLYSLEDIERITLQVFRDHLPEPTHSMILRRNPKSMEEAYRYIVEVQQQYYTQSGPMAGEEGCTFSTSQKHVYGLQRSLSTSGQLLMGGGQLSKSSSYNNNGSYNMYGKTKDKYDTKGGASKSGAFGSSGGYGGTSSSSASKYGSSSNGQKSTAGFKAAAVITTTASLGSSSTKDNKNKTKMTNVKSGWKK